MYFKGRCYCPNVSVHVGYNGIEKEVFIDKVAGYMEFYSFVRNLEDEHEDLDPFLLLDLRGIDPILSVTIKSFLVGGPDQDRDDDPCEDRENDA